MEGGAGSGTGAALAVLSNSDDPAPPTSEAPARVAAPLRNSRRSTKLFLVGTGTFSLGMVVPPGFLYSLRKNPKRCHSDPALRERDLSFPWLSNPERFLTSFGMTKKHFFS
jgi:hypothetical protein